MDSADYVYDASHPFRFNVPKSSEYTLTHARALACHPNFRLVAAVDTSHAARSLFSNLYSVPTYSNVHSWSISSDYSSLIYLLAVPPEFQAQVLFDSLAVFSPRFLLLEKLFQLV